MSYPSYDTAANADPACERCGVAPMFGRECCADHRRAAAIRDGDADAIRELRSYLDRAPREPDAARHAAELAAYRDACAIRGIAP